MTPEGISPSMLFFEGSLQLPGELSPSSQLDAQSAGSCATQARERLTRELGSARHDATDPHNNLTKPGGWTTDSCYPRVNDASRGARKILLYT